MNKRPNPASLEPTTGRLRDSSAVRSLQIGDVVVTYVVDGVMALRTGDFFPAIPADYWLRHGELLDAQGRVVMSAGGLLIERDRRSLLIDTGVGPVAGDTPYGPVNCGALLAVLSSLARRAQDIEAVAFTHLHFDHAGWAFTESADGHSTKTFSNARYILSAQEWAPHEHGTGIEVPSAPQKIVDQLRVTARTLIEDGAEVFPGVRAIVTPGHSPGHTSYVVTAATGRRLVVFGDVFHIPAQLAHPGWPSAPDSDTAAVLIARQRLLAELLQPNTLGFGFHFGDQPFGRLTTSEAGVPRWDPVATTVHAPAPLTSAELD
jgi:glyoxylase-like metal-dependent hydrolase (beta-lactamase superfamily II)